MVSCATTIGPTTIVGKWTYSDDTSIYNLLFTTTGTYAYEVLDKHDITKDDYSTFGSYTFDDNKVYFDSNTNGVKYTVEGKILTFGGTAFTRTAYKVFDNTENLQGVWSLNGESVTLAITSDGIAVSYQSELTDDAYGQYTLSEGNIINANGKTTKYLIIDNCLYLKEWGFLNSNKAIKLNRLTNGGKNKSFTYITSLPAIPYALYNYKTGEFETTSYTFMPDGTYTSTDASGNETSGTYTYDGIKISTSSGKNLVFMAVDDLPIGYEL